jgi:Mg-chelatase subunit ChlD
MNRSHSLRNVAAKASLSCLVAIMSWVPMDAPAQTTQGELEGRPAPVALRRCVGGANVGTLCNTNAACPGSTCTDRNVFNVSVAVLFDADAAQLTAIQNALSAGSATLFDVTDGQAQLGLATIHNNAFGTTEADFRISTTGVWWNANTGSWKVGGAVNVSIDNIQAAGAPGESVAHEFLHLAFDPRDEYESRPSGCGATTSPDSCPIAGAGGTNCIMDQGGTGTEGQFSELCWGQGNSANVTDLTGGDHDADDSTEQSRCRSNRSCWDQVAWAYPNTIAKPAGAPDPAANGATADPVRFRVIENLSRVVLVLDRSGSMALEAPARIERLKTAANDFIALAPTGAELGLVAFASDVSDEVAISALGSNRSAWTGVVDGLTPTTRTNIGGALDRARQLIADAGGVTGNTFVVLMTDGLNNEPAPAATAATTLADAIAALLAEGIEVYVTCTGGDLGLESQCSEIATGTGGFYVDSADAARLPLAFGEIAARGFGHEMLGEYRAARLNALLEQFSKLDPAGVRRARAGRFAGRPFDFVRQPTGKPKDLLAEHLPFLAAHQGRRHQFYVEKGSNSALFTLQWPEANARLSARVVAPDGTSYRMRPMPLGTFAQVEKPQPGVWTIEIARSAAALPAYAARGFSRNVDVSVAADVRHAHVRPGEPIYAFAYPRTNGHAVTSALRSISALVTRPDGSHDLLEFADRGRDANGQGDDIADDGIFTAVYRRTDLRGAYHIASFWPVNAWELATDAIGHTHSPAAPVVLDRGYRSPAFQREIRLTATVIDPRKDVEKKPEDPRR